MWLDLRHALGPPLHAPKDNRRAGKRRQIVITADGKTQISEPVAAEPSYTRSGYATCDDSEAVSIRDFRLDDYDAVLDLWSEAGLPFRPVGRDARTKVAAELEKDTACSSWPKSRDGSWE